eukprot:5495485-Pyramimonas_sp.AAC.1
MAPPPPRAGQSPLWWAAQGGHSPLWAAACNGRTETAQALLAAGASVDLRDNEGAGARALELMG